MAVFSLLTKKSSSPANIHQSSRASSYTSNKSSSAPGGWAHPTPVPGFTYPCHTADTGRNCNGMTPGHFGALTAAEPEKRVAVTSTGFLSDEDTDIEPGSVIFKQENSPVFGMNDISPFLPDNDHNDDSFSQFVVIDEAETDEPAPTGQAAVKREVPAIHGGIWSVPKHETEALGINTRPFPFNSQTCNATAGTNPPGLRDACMTDVAWPPGLSHRDSLSPGGSSYLLKVEEEDQQRQLRLQDQWHYNHLDAGFEDSIPSTPASSRAQEAVSPASSVNTSASFVAPVYRQHSSGSIATINPNVLTPGSDRASFISHGSFHDGARGMGTSDATYSSSQGSLHEDSLLPIRLKSQASAGSCASDDKDNVSLSDEAMMSASSSVMLIDTKDPNQPYAKLIERALREAPDFTMSLQGLYRWFKANTSKTNSPGRGWQNSIRHNLSMNGAFKKKEVRLTGDSEHFDAPRSTEWTLVPWAVHKGVQSTTRYRKVKAIRSPASIQARRAKKIISKRRSDLRNRASRSLKVISPARTAKQQSPADTSSMATSELEVERVSTRAGTPQEVMHSPSSTVSHEMDDDWDNYAYSTSSSARDDHFESYQALPDESSYPAPIGLRTGPSVRS